MVKLVLYEGSIIPQPLKLAIDHYAVHCWNLMGREGAAFGLSRLAQGGSFVFPWRPQKWSVPFSLTCMWNFYLKCNKHYAEFDTCIDDDLLNHIYNLEAVDARKLYPKEFVQWREDPSNLCINGVYPVDLLWERAREAWLEILLTPVHDNLSRS